MGAAIKDAENKSRTVLVRSLLCGFYSREELLTKNFKDLDRDVIEACVGKYNDNQSSATTPSLISTLYIFYNCHVHVPMILEIGIFMFFIKAVFMNNRFVVLHERITQYYLCYKLLTGSSIGH